jgi:hypothetical protein
MTAVVAFLCTDGVVLAADSMLTPSIGGVGGVGHHQGLKVEVIAGPQIFAFDEERLAVARGGAKIGRKARGRHDPHAVGLNVLAGGLDRYRDRHTF